MTEDFKFIDNTKEYYSVNRIGIIKSNDRVVLHRNFNRSLKGKVIKGSLNTNKYVCSNICIDGKQRNIQFHIVVAKTFIPNPNNYPQVNHINGIKTDNRVENLEWCTNSQNQIHSYKLGRKGNKTGILGSTNPLSINKYSLDGVFLKQYKSINSAGKDLCPDYIKATSAKIGRRLNSNNPDKECLGYKWKFHIKD